VTPYRLSVLALMALLATGGAFWLSSQRHLERAVRSGDRLLPQLRGAINDVTEVSVSRGDGSHVTLQRGADGWTVAERSYRADAGKVRKLLLDLAALEIVEEKTRDPARYAVLGVEDVGAATATGTRIDVKQGNGAIQSVIVGKTSGSRESYVRVAAAKPSFLARPQVAAEANPSRWLDTALLDLDAARVRAVTLEQAGKPARTLEGATLTAALAGALKGLALEDLRARPLETTGNATTSAVPQRARFVTWEGLAIEVEGREDGGRRWLALTATADPGAARTRPSSAALPDAAPAGATPPGATSASTPPAPAAASSPVAAVPADPNVEAGLLARRFDGREFEIPPYRYSAMFDGATAAP